MKSSAQRWSRASKRLSYALRHRPDEFGLTLAPGGWVEVAALIEAFSALQARVDERMAAQQAENVAAGKKFLEENGKREGVVTTASGLQYEVLKKANGAKPKADDVVTVHYVGTLTDGSVFDSSVERGAPIDLPVGGVIQGWVEGLQLMNVGEKYKLYIPSELAYGDQSPSPLIPPSSVLVFELELLGIKGKNAQ